MEATTEKRQAPTNVRVLRFFASDDAERAAALKELAADGSVWYEEMRKGSEVLVALECKQGPKAPALLDKCQEKLQQVCSPAMYATNDVTLAQAAVMVMQVQDKLFVAADAETSALLESRLEKIEGVQAVFDFGRQSYNHPRFADKIEEGGTFGRANAADPVLAAQGRVKEAYRLSGADFAVSCVPLEGQHNLILLGGKKGFWERKLAQGENAALWMLDMLRRAALDKPQASGVSWQSYGALQKAAENAAAQTAPTADKADAYSYLPPRTAAPVPPPQTLSSRENPAQKAQPLPEEAQPAETSDAGEQAPAEPPKKSGAGILLLTLLITALAAALTLGVLWYLSGGDPVSFWNMKLLSNSSVNGASLL